MEKVLIVDGNNLAAKHYCVMSSSRNSGGLLQTNSGIRTTVIYGVLNSLTALSDNYQFDRAIICWDGGSAYRKNIFKHYKANRAKQTAIKDVDVYYEELDTAREYFGKMGISQFYIKGTEADDLIGYLSRKFTSDISRAVIFSDDKDFFQLLTNEKLKIFRPTKYEFVSKVEAEEKLGYPVSAFNKVVALCGQQKDNIPGACELSDDGIMKLYRFGEKTAYKMLLNEDNTIKKLLEVKESLDLSLPRHQQIEKNWKGVKLSYKLSKIRIKDEDYAKEELSTIKKLLLEFQERLPLSRSYIEQVSSLLEFRSINLAKVLIRIGVKLR